MARSRQYLAKRIGGGIGTVSRAPINSLVFLSASLQRGWQTGARGYANTKRLRWIPDPPILAAYEDDKNGPGFLL